MLFGQSAGAAAVAAHIVSERSVGLFQRAGMSSCGFVDWNSQVMAASEEMYDEVLLNARCYNVSCLELAPADLLRNISAAVYIASDPTGDIHSTGLSGRQRWGGVANPSVSAGILFVCVCVCVCVCV